MHPRLIHPLPYKLHFTLTSFLMLTVLAVGKSSQASCLSRNSAMDDSIGNPMYTTQLQYITVHYITLHYTTLRYITLHCITIQCNYNYNTIQQSCARSCCQRSLTPIQAHSLPSACRAESCLLCCQPEPSLSRHLPDYHELVHDTLADCKLKGDKGR